MKKLTVCVDVDGVLADNSAGWKGVDHFGKPIPGAVQFTKELKSKYHVIIYSCRTNPELGRSEATFLLVNRVRKWLDDNGFAYDEIYGGEGKPIAHAYIDDRAVRCVPAHYESNPSIAYKIAMVELEAISK